MKKLIIGGLAALLIGLAGAPVAGADCCEHEFDWACPYYDAFEHHGIRYLADEVGVPLANQADRLCKGRTSREEIRDVNTHWQGGRRLTNVEVEKVIAAAYDVCPEMASA